MTDRELGDRIRQAFAQAADNSVKMISELTERAVNVAESWRRQYEISNNDRAQLAERLAEERRQIRDALGWTGDENLRVDRQVDGIRALVEKARKP